VRTLVDSRRGTWSVERVRQAAIAYADNTTWLGKSKEEIESILAIEEKGRKNLIRGLQDMGIFFVEQLLDQNGNRRAVKEELIGDTNNTYILRMATDSEEDYRKRRYKVLTENWRIVEDTNSLEKSSIKVFQCIEKQKEDGSSKIVKEEKRVCPIPTDMLEEMQKMGHEMKKTLEQQLQSNREKNSNILVFYTDGSLKFIEDRSKMRAGWVQKYYRVELGTRAFLRKVFDAKNSTRWHESKAVQGFKQEGNEEKYN
ncbi:26757_t:CDS:2, partial [Gigaspora margarita]